MKHVVRVCPSRIINETYVAISEESQYLYFRNYMKRIVICVFTLDFPKDTVKQFPEEHTTKREQKRLIGCSWV